MKSLEIKRRNNPTKEDIEASGVLSPIWLVGLAEEDYFSMRLLGMFGGGILFNKIIHCGGECLEKIMKAYLLENKKIRVSELKTKYKHNLEKIRKKCAVADTMFENDGLKDFCENYAKQGNEIFRFGINEEIEKFGGNLKKVIKLVDKFFIKTLLKIKNGFFAYNSKISSIFLETIFSKTTKKRIPSIDLVKRAVAQDNLELKK